MMAPMQKVFLVQVVMLLMLSMLGVAHWWCPNSLLVKILVILGLVLVYVISISAELIVNNKHSKYRDERDTLIIERTSRIGYKTLAIFFPIFVGVMIFSGVTAIYTDELLTKGVLLGFFVFLLSRAIAGLLVYR